LISPTWAFPLAPQGNSAVLTGANLLRDAGSFDRDLNIEGWTDPKLGNKVIKVIL
jgi:hypothetical protein